MGLIMDQQPPDQPSLLWYAKEISWTLLCWLVLAVMGYTLPWKIFGFILMFATFMVIVWVRALASRDDALARMDMGSLMRHTLIVTIFTLSVCYTVIRIITLIWPDFELGFNLLVV